MRTSIAVWVSCYYILSKCDPEISAMTEKVVKTEEEWRAQLSAEEYHVTREHGTERAFTGRYHNEKRQGRYDCICCGQPLFASETKYDSGTGWPVIGHQSMMRPLQLRLIVLGLWFALRFFVASAMLI